MSESDDFNKKAEALHADLIAGHPTAPAQLAEFLLPSIYRALKRKFANIKDEHLVQTAANNAVCYYLRSPTRFDPVRGSLVAFVWQRAKSSMLNLLSSSENLSKKKEFVELSETRTVYNSGKDLNEIEEFLIKHEQDIQTFNQLRKLLPDPLDHSILEMMMEGVRETAQFAEVLGISDESIERQREYIKKCKDRIKKVIQRHYKKQK